jgi:transposase
MKKFNRKKNQKKILRPAKVNNLERINPNACGVDVGASELHVCVPEDRDPEPVRVFDTFTCELYNIAAWLKECGIKSVAMESTGIYWIPLYEVLEAAGFEVKLVNAREVKNLPGRKTDILDCQWIQQLHSYGLLRASFRPPEQITALRSLVRHREQLTSGRAMHIQRMQKALHLMNLQLDNVLSDITGVTGMRILRAIVAGERDLDTLASYRDPSCKNSLAVIRQSLEGNYRPEHLFQLKQSLALYDYHTQLIKECDQEIAKKYQDMLSKADPPIQPPPAKRQPKQRGKKGPAFDLRTQLYQMAGVDLTAINGCNAATIQTVLSETGPDMGPWPTCGQFTSWLRLCPHNDISGGKVLKSRTQKTKNRATTALRLAAQSLTHSNSWLGAFYRRQKARLGAPKAITASSHKIARIIYHMLKERKEFVDLGADHYEAQYRKRQTKGLMKKAASLGFRLVPNDAPEPVATQA